MRFPASRGKADANQAAIVRALRTCGVPVIDLSGVGGGVPDVVVRTRRGEIRFLEVKTAKGKLRPSQVEFAKAWPVCVVRSVEDALIAAEVGA